jgi:hypothetical protein
MIPKGAHTAASPCPTGKSDDILGAIYLVPRPGKLGHCMREKIEFREAVQC